MGLKDGASYAGGVSLRVVLYMGLVCPSPASLRNTPRWDSKKDGGNSKRQSGSEAHVRVKYARLPDALLRAATIPGENL